MKVTDKVFVSVLSRGRWLRWQDALRVVMETDVRRIPIYSPSVGRRVLVRADLQERDLSGNIRVFTTGDLMAHLAPLEYGNTGYRDARDIMKLGMASKGLLLAASFTVKGDDGRTARRLFTEEDIQNWVDFSWFVRTYKLLPETFSMIGQLGLNSRGFLLYHLWRDARRRGDWRSRNHHDSTETGNTPND